jgi:hypothetical protein
MKRMRIELTKSKATADSQANLLRGLGFAVDAPQSCEIVWVNDPQLPNPLVTYADPSDKEVWIVIGRL